jgi:CRISPR/Cas system-associated endoribonuclease Cas2
MISTDSRIALESLKNPKIHTHLIEQIRKKVIKLENQNWTIEFKWIKAHAGNQGNELVDQLAKEAASSSDYNECYNRIPKSAVKCELSENSFKNWQTEWDCSTKGAITKLYFPKITDRLKLKINVTPNFTTMVSGHGNIKSYLYKYNIIDSATCLCKKGEQTIDHIIYECEVVEQERERLKAAVLRTENWPINKEILMNKYSKTFKKFTENITFDRV